jgi:UDP:flavonoid glycosyltransferase YjiC (YdhE family)
MRLFAVFGMFIAFVKRTLFYSHMTPSCLFVVNGLGLGNSTRCHAVIERLAAAGCRVHMLTSGNGLAYFEGRNCLESLHPMESFFYSKSGGGISGWAAARSIGSLARLARAKRNSLAQLLDKVNPDIAVIDSEYAISPLRHRGIPIVAINNSEVVVTEFLKRRHQAKGVRSHFWLVEFSDYLFHRHYCDLILSPFPVRAPTRHPKFRRIGLIVRPAVKALAAAAATNETLSPRQLRKVVFMLSGSVHASRIDFNGRQYPFAIEVVGRSGESHGNVTFHGRQLNNTELLSSADALVINGGYSALSESFAFRKPTFVLPVPGHAEQFVNASLASDLGLGFRVTEHDVLDRLLEMHRSDSWSGRKPMPPAFEIDGDEEAAEAILVRAAARRKNPMEFTSAARLQPEV